MGRKVSKSKARPSPSKPKTTKNQPKSKTALSKTKKVAKATAQATPKRTSKAAAPVKRRQRAIPQKAAKVNNTKEPKKALRQKEPKAERAGPKGYTEAQFAKFKEFKLKFEKLSNQELKDMLSKNYQSKTGNKDDLVFKCADGATLGRIPRCPNCFGGRPRFDFQKGVYTCPGYRDDTDFHNCHSTFTKDDIKRDPWLN